MNKNKAQELGKKALPLLGAAVVVGANLAGAQTQDLDPKPIATAAVTTIGGVMAAGAAVLAASVGGRIAVKWIKRLVGMA